MPPPQGGRVHRDAVHEGAVKPKHSCLVLTDLGVERDLFLPYKTRVPRVECVLMYPARKQVGRRGGGGMVQRRAPTAFAGPEIRVARVQQARASAAAPGANVASVEAGEGRVHPQARGLHGGHGGLELKPLRKQVVAQRGLLGRERPGDGPGAQLHGVPHFHGALAHKGDVHVQGVLLGQSSQRQEGPTHEGQCEVIRLLHSWLGSVVAASNASISRRRSETASCTSATCTLARMELAVARA